MRFLTSTLLTASLLATPVLPAAEIPHIQKNPNGTWQLIVEGHPYLILGAQTRNSSGFTGPLEKAWPLFKELNANTAEVPVYWEVVEPQPGKYDFSSVDKVIEGARTNNLHLILLWFATWKNGQMDYAPQWIKDDPTRFPRMRDRAGDQIKVLSPLSTATRAADANAFAALMAHIKQFDSDRRTVIMMQVENEPGSLESDRDYSPDANKLYAGQAPAKLTLALHKKSGTWVEAFGPEEAPEAFSAYNIATYINTVAAAGKAEYPLPMYVNCWLRERKSFERPGDAYPSGGATSNVLDLWKVTTPRHRRHRPRQLRPRLRRLPGHPAQIQPP